MTNETTATVAGKFPAGCVIKASAIGVKTLTALAALALLAPQDSAHAQEAGSFRIVQSYVRNDTTIEHAGRTFTGGSLAGTAMIVESSGPPFAAGGAGLVECLVFARTAGNGVIDLEAPCTMTDGVGDELHFVARRQDGDTVEGGGGAGVFEIVGGTGSHAGLSGECPYDAHYLAEDRVVLYAACSWKTP